MGCALASCYVSCVNNFVISAASVRSPFFAARQSGKNKFILAALLGLYSLAPLFADEFFPGEKTDFHGCALYSVQIGGETAQVLVPEKPAAGRLWVLAQQLYNLDSAPVAFMTRTEIELVKRGFHVVVLELGNIFGAPDAIAKYDALYREMTGKFGLASQAALMGLSREGLSIARWAAANPGKVTCLYMDKAVCDFKSWPGGKLGVGKGSPPDWESLLKLYGFKSEAEALAYDQNPIDLAPKLVAAKVAILYLAGESDEGVPYSENGARMEQEYKRLGGMFELILHPGEGHHPHGSPDPKPVVDFIERHAEPPAETPAQHEARMGWWREARFGMFIHWDMSSIAGTEISWSRKASRPLDVDRHPAGYVEDPLYDHLYEKFDPQKFNAVEWVRLAKQAGMKYIVFTAKHHGGFCMWDTKFTDYSIMHTPFKRDVIKELSEACHAAGLRFGLYYSPRDWHHPDYGIGDNAKYHQYLKGQLTELLTHYGKVDVMWFDSFGKGDSIQYWHADEIMALVKRLQPGIIINDRCAYFEQKIKSLAGDFDTPEQRLGEFQNTRDWESCMCLVNAPDGGWSYRLDGQVKTFADALKTLLGCATGDGNLLLDVGPDATGIIPADQAGRLVEMGGWLEQNGDSIYGTRGGPWKPTKTIASTRKGDAIFLHVFQWDGDRVTLPDIARKVKSAQLLAGGAVQVTQADGQLVLHLPASTHAAMDTIIVLKLDGSAMTLPVLNIPSGKSSADGNSKK